MRGWKGVETNTNNDDITRGYNEIGKGAGTNTNNDDITNGYN